MTEQQKLAALDQEQKLQKLFTYYKKGERILGLYGKAGVGKTYCALTLANKIAATKKENLKIVGCALTNKAAGVLARVMPTTMTIAKLLQLKKQIDPITGKVSFIPKTVNKKRPPIEEADIIIVDECSQVGSEYYDMLLHYKQPDSVIIFMGDWRQTPPPEKTKTGKSPTFDLDYFVKLEIPFRYEGILQKFNDSIGDLITNEEEDPKNLSKILKKFEGSDIILHRTKRDFIDSYVQAKGEEGRDAAIVFYRNDTTKKEATAIKKRLSGGTDSNLYYKKDLILSRVSLPITVYKGANLEYSGKGYVHAQEVYEVHDIETKTLYYDLDLNVYDEIPLGKIVANLTKVSYQKATLKLDKEKENYASVNIVISSPKNVSNYKRLLKLLGDKAKATVNKYSRQNKKMNFNPWEKYYNVKESFLDCIPGYAFNTYVVQGETVDTIYVDATDIFSVKPISFTSKLQSMYTACTRARNQIHIRVK